MTPFICWIVITKLFSVYQGDGGEQGFPGVLGPFGPKVSFCGVCSTLKFYISSKQPLDQTLWLRGSKISGKQLPGLTYLCVKVCFQSLNI